MSCCALFTQVQIQTTTQREQHSPRNPAVPIVVYQFACNYYSRDKTIFIINNILKMRNTTHHNHHTCLLPNLNMNIISNIAMNTISRLPGSCLYVVWALHEGVHHRTEFGIRKPSPATRKHDIRMLMLYGKLV